MLDRTTFQPDHSDDAHSKPFDLAFVFGFLKRRALYFIVPFVLVALVGSLVTAAWPARYISQGTIIITSQEIPSDLVRPAVASLANDRIKIIQQRIMTRDNLLELAKKYQLTAGLQERMSGTEIVDFIRDRTIIKPMEDSTLAREGSQRKDVLAFKVGFEYEKPQVAMRMANELVTKFLNEDLRSRTEFAEQTTKLLEREVKRLEAQLGLISDQIGANKKSNVVIPANSLKTVDIQALSALRAELVVKSASYSDEHPDIRALKRKIATLEHRLGPDAASAIPEDAPSASKAGAALSSGTNAKPGTAQNPSGVSVGLLETLETQQIGLRVELNAATQKLSIARLGENVQKDQRSERLEVIEQPTVPNLASKPNKPKLYLLILGLAAMAGVGLMFAAELFDHSLRRSEDLLPLVDSQLIVTIPYITTAKEKRQNLIKVIGTTTVFTAFLGAGVIAIVFFLPPLDELFEKTVVRLMH